jgi:hypothetical protein
LLLLLLLLQLKRNHLTCKLFKKQQIVRLLYNCIGLNGQNQQQKQQKKARAKATLQLVSLFCWITKLSWKLRYWGRKVKDEDGPEEEEDEDDDNKINIKQ